MEKSTPAEMAREEIQKRLIKWCDLHGVVVGGPIYNGMKLLVFAEVDRASTAQFKAGMMEARDIVLNIHNVMGVHEHDCYKFKNMIADAIEAEADRLERGKE